MEDVQAMRKVFFCTELKHVLTTNISAQTRSSKCQLKLFIEAGELRQTSLNLLESLGHKITANMAKKIAQKGIGFKDLQDLASKKNQSDFAKNLHAQGLSKICCKKLIALFYS